MRKEKAWHDDIIEIKSFISGVQEMNIFACVSHMSDSKASAPQMMWHKSFLLVRGEWVKFMIIELDFRGTARCSLQSCRVNYIIFPSFASKYREFMSLMTAFELSQKKLPLRLIHNTITLISSFIVVAKLFCNIFNSKKLLLLQRIRCNFCSERVGWNMKKKRGTIYVFNFILSGDM